MTFNKTPPWAGNSPPANSDDLDRVTLISASFITPIPVRWLWDGWLASGKLALLAGAPGTGKTTLATNFAAIVTRGSFWPDGSRSPLGKVLIWSGEDDYKDTLVPRLLAAGANMDLVKFIGDTTCVGATSRLFDPSKDLPALFRAIAETSNGLPVRLIIIDPVVSAISGDSHKNAEVRRGLQPLVELAEKLDCSVLGITHFSKGTQGRDAFERVNGSIAFVAVARLVMATNRICDEDGTAIQILARAKSNIGPDDGGFRYDCEQLELTSVPGVVTSRIRWGGAVDGSSQQLLSNVNHEPPENGGGKLNAAMQFLRELLEKGPLTATTVRSNADDAGIAWATVKRAQKALKIKPFKGGLIDGWWWGLPQKGSATGQDVQPVKSAQQSNVSSFTDYEQRRKNVGKEPSGAAPISSTDDIEYF